MIERNMSVSERIGAKLITWYDKEYPEALRTIFDPPLFLFRLGSNGMPSQKALAVVGTRRPTEYGKRTAEYLSRALAEREILTVSGLASGIDTVVHRATLDAGGKTVAILGSGIAHVYPWSNRLLADRIASTGWIFSEFLPETGPDAQNFPRRNRIISGMALGTIVIETGVKGGAVITAHTALDQNREVFAVPGPIFSSTSDGCHMLIRRGIAHLCTGLEDILEQIPLLSQDAPDHHVRPARQLRLEDQRLLNALGTDPLHIDELSASIGIPIPELLVHLLRLEFEGLVNQLPGKHFVRNS
ncbi:MAG: DNA-processing protein DprA [Bacteroidota bacterium]|nr:DNA-processing protein DprA [Bacteroidota bacterium]